MILSLLTGCVIGFCVAIPPGAVMFVMVRSTLREGKHYAMKIAYGIALLDVIYSFLFSLATGKITHTVSVFSVQYPHLIIAFQVVCILGLILYGIVNVRNSYITTTQKQTATEGSDSPTVPAFMRTLTKQGPFFLGIALALANLVNPAFVPLMTSVTYVAGHYGFVQEGMVLHHIVFAFGYASGIFAWLSLVIFVSFRYRHLFSEQRIVHINRVLGWTMIGIGTYWGFQRFGVLLWAMRDSIKLGLAL
jgi:threonine/homoserine/homoserine lactone efflux protein